ncbi:DUF4398 domain-containing protein [Acetatifactor muris]|uniref:DUF4398 domain-containing protein n=1 Tax=Acetatifactor muris TaxID=879566 RepID=UPI0023F03DA0|nr:DUF4398 domain-containing protein [Acetatifactor muris]
MHNSNNTEHGTNSNTHTDVNSNANNGSNDTGSISGDRLWDEILKAIVDTMPEQLFPLFREAFGKEYPPGTPITLLRTEHSTYADNPDKSPSSNLMDITLLVADTDYYHLECQMRNDSQMVLRMLSYDLHFSLQHTTPPDPAAGEIVLRFPRSVVIYPDRNTALPDSLRCRLVFSDHSEHIYQVPAVKIQTYTLEQIRRRHLYLFLPYTLLRLRPKLDHVTPLTKEELTAFVKEVIVILEEDTAAGYLTSQESFDYIQLLLHASKHIFHKHPDYHEEVLQVTKPLIKLPSVELSETKKALDRAYAEIADKDAELANSRAEITRLREMLLALQGSSAPQG